MKKYKIVSLVILISAVLAILAGYSFSYQGNTGQTKHKVNAGFAVVELFTSEGCSSCPPADNAVAKLLSKQLADVYILCFHVDYWNRLGWTDPFSQPLFSARQNKYAETLSLESIYTPQIVVNGVTEFVGSNEARLNAAVAQSLNKEAKSDLSIKARRDADSVAVTYAITGDAVLLNLALVQPDATTVVKRGENGGKTLHHINIVRALHTADIKGAGHLAIRIPEELSAIPLQLIAYTQSKKDLKILGVGQQKL